MLRIAPILCCLASYLAPPASAQDIHVLGEIHDNPHHHLRQADEIRDISPASLVFEMLTPAQAANLDGIARDDPAALEEALGWHGTGWPDFALYAPIFAAAPEAQIFGAALPREVVRRAVTDGAAAVLDDPAWPLAPLPQPEQSQREAEQMANHCDALPAEMLPGMVEAQRLRDAAFARATVEAFQKTGGPVVVITGNGHARNDRGIPFMLAHAYPEITVDSLGQFETDATAEEAAPYDRIAISPPAERPDPCAAFAQ